MESVIHKISGLSKKNLLLWLAIPILFGFIGWIVPEGKAPSLYTSQALIDLGSYESSDLNTSNQVTKLLTHSPFYKQNLPELPVGKRTEIIKKIHVTPTSEKMIKISYTDTSESGALQIVNQVTEAFLELDHEKFEKSEKLLESTITHLSTMKVSPDAQVDREKFLYELQHNQLNLKSAELLDSASENGIAIENKSLTSKDRAIFGVILGMSLVLVWRLLLVFFRKPSA